MINASHIETCLKTYLYIILFHIPTWALLLRAHDESLLDHLHLAKRSTISVYSFLKKALRFIRPMLNHLTIDY